MKCEMCGHVQTTKRQKPIAPIAVDVSALNEADARAYFTKTAPYADVQFMIDNGRGLSPELLADARALASTVDASGRFSPGTTRASFYRQYYALSARRRRERDAQYWRTVVIPAQKAAAWRDSLRDDRMSIGARIAAIMALRYVVARHSAPEALAA